MRPLRLAVIAVLAATILPAPSMARQKARGRRVPTPVVQRLSPVEIEGSLKEDAVFRIIRRGMAAIRVCYQRGLKRDASLGGKLTLTCHINSVGRVMSVETSGGEWDARVSSCIKNYSRRWRFPAPGADAKVSVGFVLKRMTKQPGPVPRWPATGVPACDHHIRNYLTCLFKNVSAATRADILQKLRPTHQAWRKAARAPERRPMLIKTCKAAARKAERVFNVYGCWRVK